MTSSAVAASQLGACTTTLNSGFCPIGSMPPGPTPLPALTVRKRPPLTTARLSSGGASDWPKKP